MAQNPIENLCLSYGEGSTAVLQAYCYDANGDTEVPTSLTWKFMDEDGNYINSRDGETETPADPTLITLTETDLAISAAERAVLVAHDWQYIIRCLDVTIVGSTRTFHIQRMIHVEKLLQPVTP